MQLTNAIRPFQNGSREKSVATRQCCNCRERIIDLETKTNNMSLHDRVCWNIRKWREFKGVKQETLARQLGITKAALSHIENGRVALSISRMEAIATFLDLEFVELMQSPQDGTYRK